MQKRNIKDYMVTIYYIYSKIQFSIYPCCKSTLMGRWDVGRYVRVNLFRKTCCHTVQYYSITVLQFTIWNRYRSLLYIYNIYYIYNNSFCNSQIKTVILYVRTLGLFTGWQKGLSFYFNPAIGWMFLIRCTDEQFTLFVSNFFVQ